MSIQNKLTRVVPVASSPYIKGTEAPNYYLVVNEAKAATVGFRPLAVAVPAADSKPATGVQTRVRVVPTDQSPEGLKKFACVIECVLGFGSRRYSGDSQTHFSLVSSDASAVIAKVATALQLLA